jgi:hypothetical protein
MRHSQFRLSFRIVREFDRESSSMDMKGELMVSVSLCTRCCKFHANAHDSCIYMRCASEAEYLQGDAIDSALEGEDDEQRVDDQVALILGELGIEVLGGNQVRNPVSLSTRYHVLSVFFFTLFSFRYQPPRLLLLSLLLLPLILVISRGGWPNSVREIIRS